jgi:omega-6 fatty acid desaturase (delta-12 desaturase)
LLEEAHNAVPPLQQATTVTISTSLKAISFKLWDEQNKGFLTFKDVRPLLRAAQTVTAGAAKSKPEPPLTDEVA